jgi:uncharacterized membrane protein
MKLLGERKEVTGVRSNNLEDTPEFAVNIDDARAGALSLTTNAIDTTLSTAMGGTYVNDFLNQGRVKRVYMQGDTEFRMLPGDIDRWSVRNTLGQMVPFSAFSSSKWSYGSPQLQRYNGSPAYEFVGDAAAGVSSGVAMSAVEDVMKQMPSGIGYEWTGASFQERLSGAQAPLLYAISILFVFLCLAALYESWSVPFSVILVVPLGIVGALLFTGLRGLSNDVYFQVGLLTTVGLSSKNAILIVEFAKQLQEQGRSVLEATLMAVRLRLRPILMTSLAFGFGVLPLAIGTGAGAGGRQSIGTAVLGGMVIGTALGIFFVPLFFVLIRGFLERRKAKADSRPVIAGWHHHRTRQPLMARISRHSFALLALPALLLTGLHEPGARVMSSPPRPCPPAGRAGASASVATAAPLNTGWRDFFTDERLRGVVALALANNRDLKVSALNIERARAAYDISRADLYPSVDIGASGSRARTPASTSSSGKSSVANRFSADVGLTSYEIDFFGRVRNLNDAALEDFFQTEESRRSTQISLVAAVANSWLHAGRRPAAPAAGAEHAGEPAALLQPGRPRPCAGRAVGPGAGAVAKHGGQRPCGCRRVRRHRRAGHQRADPAVLHVRAAHVARRVEVLPPVQVQFLHVAVVQLVRPLLFDSTRISAWNCTFRS